MDSTKQAELTLGEALPWLNMTLDYTDKLAQLVPDELLDWRPEDPGGSFCFSIAEIVKHCADARRMFARQLEGSESKEDYWSEEPGEDGVWKFREHSDKAEIISSLADSRRELAPWFNRPLSALTEITEGTRASFAKQIAWMKEHDHPYEDAERRGPANINRVLMAVAVHEAGHRGTLQAHMRQHGINHQADG